MSVAALLLCALWGCAGDGPGTTDAPIDLTPDQGVSAWVRTAEGDRALQALVTESGTNRAEPDAASLTYFLGLLPGSVSMGVSWDGHVQTFTVPEIEAEHLSSTQLVTMPSTAAAVDDVAVAHTLVGDRFTIEVPDGAALADGDAVSGPVDVDSVRLGAPTAAVSPGSLVAVRNDDDLEPIELMDTFWLRARTADDDQRTISFSAPATVTLELDPPVVAEPDGWSLYSYSSSRGFWTRAADLTVDPASGTATGEIKILGWWAIGRPAADRQGCVQGRVVDSVGRGLTGPEVRLIEDGRVVADRRTAVEGTFCLPVTPGGSGTLDILGLEVDRTALYTLQHPFIADGTVGVCGGECTELGDVVVDAWVDADADLYFTGPGGDCDDTDASVNPSPALGDGSWCGEGQ